MTTVAFVLGIVVYMAYRFVKKRRTKEDTKEVKIVEFEDEFKATYGTTWETWVAVKRDVLNDNEALICCVTRVFSDMYRTMQEINGGVK